ncbi:MAG: hypothetical protein IJY06_06830 [Oscillospiraceae bacterium]|nr:hypothetical protein [Oscillospiraceae bacterium]
MAGKRQLRNPNYLKAVVIVHGKSELDIVKYITSNLHLNIKPDSKDNGTHSIQITSLIKEHLNKKPFSTMNNFLKEYDVETTGTGKNKKLVNFKLFIIMDTDDCTEQQKQDFISGAMFEGHWLAPYIVPVYSITNLEDVMVESGIMTKRIKCDDKGSYYSKIFPINKKPLSNDTIAEIKTFRDRLAKSVKKKHTNLPDFIEYCLENIKQFK